MVLDFKATLGRFREFRIVRCPGIRRRDLGIVRPQRELPRNGSHDKMRGKSQRQTAKERQPDSIRRSDLVNISLVLDVRKTGLQGIIDFFVKVQRVLLRKRKRCRTETAERKRERERRNFQRRRRIRLSAVFRHVFFKEKCRVERSVAFKRQRSGVPFDVTAFRFRAAGETASQGDRRSRFRRLSQGFEAHHRSGISQSGKQGGADKSLPNHFLFPRFVASQSLRFIGLPI